MAATKLQANWSAVALGSTTDHPGLPGELLTGRLAGLVLGRRRPLSHGRCQPDEQAPRCGDQRRYGHADGNGPRALRHRSAPPTRTPRARPAATSSTSWPTPWSRMPRPPAATASSARRPCRFWPFPATARPIRCQFTRASDCRRSCEQIIRCWPTLFGPLSPLAILPQPTAIDP